MVKNYFIINSIFIPIKVTFFHMIGNRQNQSVLFFTIFPFDSLINHSFNIVSVKTIFRLFLRIRQSYGSNFYIFSILNWIRRIYIQFKIGHNKKLIPKLMLKIRHITKVRIHISHYLYSIASRFITFFLIFNTLDDINKLLKMSTIFRLYELSS